MPMDRTKYPADWERVSRLVRFERAGGRCEADLCDAPHGETILRSPAMPELWRREGDGEPVNHPEYYRVRVILTTTHLCDCAPLCGNPDHLKALCQLHHLRLDAPQHARNAAATRARRADLGRDLLARMEAGDV